MIKYPLNQFFIKYFNFYNLLYNFYHHSNAFTSIEYSNIIYKILL